MKLLEALKRPAVRVPLLMIVIVGCSLWAFRSCSQQVRFLRLARARHLSFIQLLAAVVEEAEARPAGLGQLARPAKEGELSPLRKRFLRDFAERPEFKELADPESEPAGRLGKVDIWDGAGEPGKECEIAWSGYMFRLYPRPGNEKDFVIFSWPRTEGKAQLTLAYLSTEPGRVYYTSAPRYVGPEKGPKLEDLGEAPFDGEVHLLSPEAVGDSPQEFIEKAEEADGRLWAVEKMTSTSPQTGGQE